MVLMGIIKYLSFKDIRQIARNQCGYLGACKTQIWPNRDKKGNTLPITHQSAEQKDSIQAGINYFKKEMEIADSEPLTLLQIAEYMQEGSRAYEQITDRNAGDKVWELRKATSISNYSRRQNWSIHERIHYYNKLIKIPKKKNLKDSPLEIRVSVDTMDLDLWKQKNILGKIEFRYPDIRLKEKYLDLLNGCFKGDEDKGDKDEKHSDQETNKGFDFLKFYAQLATLNHDIILFEPHLNFELGDKDKTILLPNVGIEAAIKCKEVDPSAEVILYSQRNLRDYDGRISSYGIQHCIGEKELSSYVKSVVEEGYKTSGRLHPIVRERILKGENVPILDLLHSGVTTAQLCEISYLSRMANNSSLMQILVPSLKLLDHLVFEKELISPDSLKDADPDIRIDGKTLYDRVLEKENYEIANLIKK